MEDLNNKKIVLGPLLDEDAQFLQAIIKMCTPMVVMEFGHLWGNSARAMLSVMHPEAKLYSYDNTKTPEQVKARTPDPRLIFHPVSQEDFDPVENVDLVFLDASHDLDLNIQTFEKIAPNLSSKAIIAVHDTGTWPSNVFGAKQGYEKNGRYIHNPGELHFVNWVRDTYPTFQQIHFHSEREVRHGITLLQRYERLNP